MPRRPRPTETRLRAALLEIAACELTRDEQSALARVALGIGNAVDKRRADAGLARVDAMDDQNEDLERRRRA